MRGAVRAAWVPVVCALWACGGSDPDPRGEEVADVADTSGSGDATEPTDTGDDTESDADVAGDTDEDVADITEDLADTAPNDADDSDASDADEPDADPGPPFYQTPWVVPDRAWTSCPDSPFATPESLADKAAYYQWIVPRLHRVSGTTEDGREITHALFHHITLDGPAPTTIVPDEELPHVIDMQSFGNAGLFTSLYLASQAFRYGAAVREGDEAERLAALEEVRVVLDAEYALLRITGVPGLFARAYHSPIPPFDPQPSAGEDHHVEDGEFAGYTWVGDVSQDEYSGHMFAIGAVARLVDDPDVQAICRDIASQVGHHFVDHDLVIYGVDGEPTTYGHMNAQSFTHFPGYNAWLTLDWLLLAGQISGEAALVDYYEDCLLQGSGPNPCVDTDIVAQPYTDHFDTLSILQGCDTNHDSVSMAFLAATHLVGYEGDETRRRLYQRTMHTRLMTGDPAGRDPSTQANPLYNLIYAAFADPDDPDTDIAVQRFVDDALCTLREFPATQIHRDADTTVYPEFCVGIRHGSQTEAPVPWRERWVDQFVFWFSPYERLQRTADPTRIEPPSDFLLPYWMGRYFGWITPEM